MDTILLSPDENSYKLHRTLRFDVETPAEIYRVVIYKSLIESNELIERIVLIVTLIVILFILFLYLINRFMFGRSMVRFSKTVEKLKAYDVNTVKNIEFGASEITEFKLLNSTLNQMIAKIRLDYENVREFTGNISSEFKPHSPSSGLNVICSFRLHP